jgi:hypothetical protein
MRSRRSSLVFIFLFQHQAIPTLSHQISLAAWERLIAWKNVEKENKNKDLQESACFENTEKFLRENTPVHHFLRFLSFPEPTGTISQERRNRYLALERKIRSEKMGCSWLGLGVHFLEMLEVVCVSLLYSV